MKIMMIAFVGIHVPLLVFGVYVLVVSDLTASTIDSVLVILLATLTGTGVTLYLIQKLLDPVRQTVDAMMRHEAGKPVAFLPNNYQDEVGFLMRAANIHMNRTSDQLRKYRSEAEIDPLTKAFNRRGLSRKLIDINTGYMLHFDIDEFKRINDKFGHATGDEVLIALTDLIHKIMRSKDVFARVGGEEFVLFMAVCVEEAERTAERILDSVRSETFAGIKLTLSIGLVEYTGNIEATMMAADRATYAAKRAGKNQLVVNKKKVTK